jgi:type II secretory pathway pseudopilin PulG
VVELLVVIGIIAVLVGITFAVGRTVISGGKKQQTQDVLRALEAALQTYLDENDNPPPMVYSFDTTVPAPKYFLMIDGRAADQPKGPMVNSVGLFLAEAERYPKVKQILDGLPSERIKVFDIDGSGPQPPMRTVFDAWDNPIRFVHPDLDGKIYGDGSTTAQPVQPTDSTRLYTLPNGATFPIQRVRRNHTDDVTPAGQSPETDSDGGIATSNRPYFYSAGEDAKVGYQRSGAEWLDFNADNVYVTQPKLPKKPA